MTTTKDFYALNLTDGQLSKLISKIELDVTEQLTTLQERKGPLDEVTVMYTDLKAEYEKINSDLNDNKTLLEALIRYRENPRGAKQIRVLRTTSLNAINQKKGRYFKWVSMGVEILISANTFMSVDALFNKMLSMNPEIEKSVAFDKNQLQKMKHKMHLNFLDLSKERKKICEYKGKFGLASWLDKHHVPRPEYIKDFMFDKGVKL